MGFNKILLPLDGSTNAEIALPYAIQVTNPDGHIHLLSVVDENSLSEMAIIDVMSLDEATLEKMVQNDEPNSQLNSELFQVMTRRKYLIGIASRLKTLGFKTTVQVTAGYASNMIQRIAHEGFDLVVMASHGRTGLDKAIFGSVAEHTLHHAGCPVLIVPSPQT